MNLNVRATFVGCPLFRIICFFRMNCQDPLVKDHLLWLIGQQQKDSIRIKVVNSFCLSNPCNLESNILSKPGACSPETAQSEGEAWTNLGVPSTLLFSCCKKPYRSRDIKHMPVSLEQPCETHCPRHGSAPQVPPCRR